MKAAKHMGGKGHYAKGGMIDKGREEEEEKDEMEGRKKGGRVHRKMGGATAAEGMMSPKRHDRPGRKRGGGVGSNKRPLTTASTTSPADGHTSDADEVTAE